MKRSINTETVFKIAATYNILYLRTIKGPKEANMRSEVKVPQKVFEKNSRVSNSTSENIKTQQKKKERS